MDGIQSQFLSNNTNFDDPTALLTYLINENESGASIVPVQPLQQQHVSPPATTSTMAHHQHHQQHGQQYNNNRNQIGTSAPSPSYQGMHHHQSMSQHHHSMSVAHSHHQQQQQMAQHHQHHQQQLLSPHHHQQQLQQHQQSDQQRQQLVNNNHSLSPGNHHHGQHHQQQQFSPNLVVVGSNNSSTTSSSSQMLYHSPPPMAAATSPNPNPSRSNQGYNYNHDTNNTSPCSIGGSVTSPPVAVASVPIQNNSTAVDTSSSPPSKIFSDTLNESGHLVTPRKELVIIPETDLKPEKAVKVKPTTPGHRGPGRPRKIRVENVDAVAENRKSHHVQPMEVDTLDTASHSSSCSKVMAQKKTLIYLKIVDQIIFNGKVVRETEKEEKFERSGGMVEWSSPSGNDSSDCIKKTSLSPLPSRTQPSSTVTSATISTKRERNNSGQTAPSPPKMRDILTAATAGFRSSSSTTSRNVSSPSSIKSSSSRSSGVERAREKRRKEGKRNGSKGDSSRDGSIKRNKASVQVPKVKTERVDSNETIDGDDDDHDEDRMRETASALLELQSSPNKIDPDSRNPSGSSNDQSSIHDSLSDVRSKDGGSGSRLDDHNEDTNQSTTESLLSNYDYNSVTFEPLNVGSHVMAKWSDKNFYAGKLVKNMGDYKWNILFEDGGKKVVHESDIVSIPYLTIGQIVMITFSGQGLCLRGSIKDVVIEKNGSRNVSTMFYSVEYSVDGTKLVTNKFSRGDVFLTADLAAPLLNRQSKSIVHQPDSNAKFADVDLNNIIPKRSRVSAQAAVKSTDVPTAPGQNLNNVSTDDSETESVSSKDGGKNKKKNSSTKTMAASPKVTAATIPTKCQNNNEDSQSSVRSNASSSNTNTSSAVSGREVASSQGRPTDEGSERKSSSSAVSDKAPSSSSDQSLSSSLASTLPQEELEELLGPIPDEGSGLFQGIAFLLTTADQNAGKATTSGRRTAPFDLYYLIRQIESGGGRVYQQLNDAQDSPGCKEIVLLAYTYLRTVKYMQCLAAGIPCLMHTWVIECCRQKELLKKDDYLLPSGYSITTNSLPSDRMVFKKSATLFKGIRFMLVSKNSRHSESWTPVLDAANAIVVDDLPASPGTSTRKASNAVDVIISDASCPSHILKKAKQLKIPIVSSEYVVQCLINGKRLPYDAHEKFNINFKS